MAKYIDVVFDGPPSHESGRFVEVENEWGQGASAGTWIECPEDGYWRLRINLETGLNDLAAKINQTSTEHGFWPQDRDQALDKVTSLLGVAPDSMVAELKAIGRYIEAQEVRNMGEMLMLAVSELAEALEEDRAGRPDYWYKHQVSCPMVLPPHGPCRCQPKPEGLVVELADCIIRCLDTLHSRGVDIDAVVEEKMSYNAGRAHKHGKGY